MSVSAVSAPTAAEMAAAATADFVTPSLGGTVADVQEALGLAPEEAAAADNDGAAAKTDAAIAADLKGDPNAKGKKLPEAKPESDADDKTEAEAKAKSDADEDPFASIKEINARTRARQRARREREQAAQKVQATPVAAPVAPAAAAKPKVDEAPPVKTPATPVAATAEDHVKAVLSLIEKMAMGDEAVAAGEAAPAPKADEARTAALGAIQDKLQELVSNVAEAKEGKAMLEQQKEQIGQLKTALEGIQAAQRIREHIEAKVEPMIDELPTLAKRRDATKILHEKFGEFYDTYKKLPNVPELARRIERALAAEASTASTETPEKPAKPSKSKTVSQDLSSPPAARTGPDKRTAAQALADFHKRFDIDT